LVCLLWNRFDDFWGFSIDCVSAMHGLRIDDFGWKLFVIYSVCVSVEQCVCR
jgi:hypothetical protein